MRWQGAARALIMLTMDDPGSIICATGGFFFLLHTASPWLLPAACDHGMRAGHASAALLASDAISKRPIDLLEGLIDHTADRGVCVGPHHETSLSLSTTHHDAALDRPK